MSDNPIVNAVGAAFNPVGWVSTAWPAIKGTEEAVKSMVPEMPQVTNPGGPPNPDDPNARQAMLDAQQRERVVKGRLSTILTDGSGGRGLSQPNLFKRTLLGG